MNPPFTRHELKAMNHAAVAPTYMPVTFPFCRPYPAELLARAESLRPILERRRRHYSDPNLERFALEFFSDNNMVWAYHFPRAVISGAASSSSPGSPCQPIAPVSLLDLKTVWTPLDVATAAADQAQSLVLPHEQELIHLAALVYPCALFDSVRSTVLGGHERMLAEPGWLDHRRGLLVECALDSLRGQQPAMADNLAALLGVPDGLGAEGEGDVDPEQIARLASAMRPAVLKTPSIWPVSRV